MQNFVEFEKEKLNVETVEINEERLDMNINHFFNNDVILIKSGTASGKTRNIAKLSKHLKEKYKCNILSIVNLISLSREQIQAFQDESDITLLDYQKDLNRFGKSDSEGVICINSLFKLKEVEDFNISNTILYIDEVNDLIRTLTHNDSLDKVLNLVYNYLIELIKNCKKVIFTDATIDQNTLNLLSARKLNNKTVLIKNLNKKFKNIKAIRYNNESDFIDELRDHIKNKKYFLFGCDQCGQITKIYNKIISEYPEQKDDFILITGETTYRPKDVSKEFKNKYVFYSPSITTGVSFVLKDVKQTQFIYITDNPLITPISVYQMSCRTRNMDKLIYFSKEIKPQKKEYETLKEVENRYKRLIKQNEKVLSMSKSINECDEIKIVNNTFFKLFCHNEYQDSIFKTGFLQHYENILNDNGFELSSKGDYMTLDKLEKQDFNAIYDLVKFEEFEEFVEEHFKVIENEEDIIETKHIHLKARCTLLNIPTKEDAEKYKVYITDAYALKNYFNFLGLFRTDEYIKLKLREKEKESFKIKTLSSVYNKLSLLSQFENHYKINRFELSFDNIDITKEISKEFQAIHATMFPRKKIIPFDCKKNLLKIYVDIIKMICGDILIITQKKAKQDKKCIYKYELNVGLIKDLITLSKYINPIFNNFKKDLIKQLTNIEPDEKHNNLVEDEDDLINNYLFNKINFKKINTGQYKPEIKKNI